MASTLNTDVVGLNERIHRFLVEVMKCASANSSQVKEADKERLKSYLSSLRAYLDHISAEPELDLPETNPKEYVLRDLPPLADIENESLSDCCRLLELCREEIINSQSARLASGIIAFDKVRQEKIIEKAERFIKDYIEVVTPLDLPESSPMDPTTPSGRLGIGSK